MKYSQWNISWFSCCFIASSSTWKMPRRVNCQSLLPSLGKIVACSGMVSPISQPNLSASIAPTTAPVRSPRKDSSWSGAITNSGYISK